MIKKLMNIVTIVGISLSLATADKWSNLESNTNELESNQEMVQYTHDDGLLACVYQPSQELEPYICVERSEYDILSSANHGDWLLATFEDDDLWILTELGGIE